CKPLQTAYTCVERTRTKNSGRAQTAIEPGQTPRLAFEGVLNSPRIRTKLKKHAVTAHVLIREVLENKIDRRRRTQVRADGIERGTRVLEALRQIDSARQLQESWLVHGRHRQARRRNIYRNISPEGEALA